MQGHDICEYPQKVNTCCLKPFVLLLTGGVFRKAPLYNEWIDASPALACLERARCLCIFELYVVDLQVKDELVLTEKCKSLSFYFTYIL